MSDRLPRGDASSAPRPHQTDDPRLLVRIFDVLDDPKYAGSVGWNEAGDEFFLDEDQIMANGVFQK